MSEYATCVAGPAAKGASEPKRAADYKAAPVAALDVPALPLISAPWASLAAPRLDAAPGRPEFQARQAHKPAKQSRPHHAPKGTGDTRKLSAVQIQAVYRGYRVRRHVANFKDSAQTYSRRLGHTKKSASTSYPHGAVQLPGAPDIANHANSEQIRQWAGKAPLHPFDALPPEQFGGSVDASPVKHYNDGLERHETKEERRERRRQRALNNPPPPPPENDDAVSVSSLGSQAQDPRTWISSRSSRRMRRGVRKSKSSGGSQVTAADTGVSNHYHHGGVPGSFMDHQLQVPLGVSDAAARAQLNPYGGGTPGGAYSMPYNNPFMPPVSQYAASPAGAPGTSLQYRYTHAATAGLGAGHGRDAGGSPQWSGYDAAEGSVFSSPPNYGASAAGPVRDIMRDLDELANMRTAATGQWPSASAFPRAGGGPGFGGLRMSYPPTLMGRSFAGGGLSSGGYIGPGGASALAGGMSPIVEHQPTHRPYRNDFDGANAQGLRNQLYTGGSSSAISAAGGASRSGGDDAASVASSMAAEAEERLSRIEKMLENLTRGQR